jgi:hypothetical protein
MSKRDETDRLICEGVIKEPDRRLRLAGAGRAWTANIGNVPEIRVAEISVPEISVPEIRVHEVRDMRARLPDELVVRLDALARTVADAMVVTSWNGNAPRMVDALVAAADGWHREAQAILKSDTIRAKHKQSQPQGHCSVGAARRLLGISERTIRRWMALGKITPVKIKGRVFLDIARLEELRRLSRVEADQASTPRWTA